METRKNASSGRAAQLAAKCQEEVASLVLWSSCVREAGVHSGSCRTTNQLRRVQFSGDVRHGRRKCHRSARAQDSPKSQCYPQGVWGIRNETVHRPPDRGGCPTVQSRGRKSENEMPLLGVPSRSTKVSPIDKINFYTLY